MRAVRSFACAVTLLAAATGCSDKKSDASSNDPAGANVKLEGIDPDVWNCDVLMTPAAMSELLGGPAHPVDNPLGTAPGTPKPCNYAFEGPTVQAWSFDLDCRPNAMTTAKALFEQYAAQNAEQIELFDAATGGKALKDDAGVEQHAVAAAREVDVGKQGLDHHGQAILFIDDDAPCYVRVAGPDADMRLALARTLAKKLTPANAPMRPHAAGK